AAFSVAPELAGADALFGATGAGGEPRVVQIQVTRRVRHDVLNRHAQILAYARRRRVSADELPACRVPCHNNDLEVRQNVAPGKSTQQIVDQVKRRELRETNRGAATAPIVGSAAIPGDFVRGELVVAARVVIGCESRGNDDGVLQRAGDQRSGHSRGEVVVRVPAGAVDDDQGALDRLVLLVQRIGTVQLGKFAAGTLREFLRAGRRGRGAGGGGSTAGQKKQHQAEDRSHSPTLARRRRS